MFNATLIHCRDPFRPHVGRTMTPIRRRARLDTLLRREGMIVGRGRAVKRLHTFMPLVNGKPVLERDWGRPVRDGDIVVIATLPKGGGSNPLNFILMIAVVVLSAYTGGAFGAAFGSAIGVGASAGAAILQTGVMLAGTFLVNALVPPARAPSSVSSQTPSPTYTIGAQGNSARLQNPIPVLYGRYRVYPDFASQPYVENSGNEEYLYQLFCISQGQISVEKVMIGDTDISSYQEVQYEIVPPGGAVTLFPDNVVTSADVTGLELLGANEKPDDAPDDWTPWVGPFVANPAATEANYIGIDITLPSGLFHADDNGNPQPYSVQFEAQAQTIDDNGTVTGDWFDLGAPVITLGTIQPQMLTYRYAVPAGRYQVRVQRVGDKDTDSRTANTLQWSGMRAYMPSTHYFGNVTLMAMIIRATNNVNSQTAKQINLIATRMLPVWNGSSWSAPVATRNPAWAFADVFRNTDYGRGLPDSRLNLASLLTLAQTWDSRGDTFDGVFDTAAAIWDAATQIANVGNAMPVYYAGVIDLVRDQPQTIRTAMFTPANITANSLQIEYLFASYDTPDYVTVQYNDDVAFQPQEVDCVLAGGTQSKAATMQLFGCTSRAQAWRWGMRQAAANRDRRRNITITTELEGYIPRYGDLVAVSHDVPEWGLSGSVLSYVGGVVTTSEPLDWSTSGQTYYMAFRRRDGSADGPYAVTQGVDEFSAVVAGAPDLYISDGASEEPTLYMFGPGVRHGLDCMVLAVEPQDDTTVQLTLVNYADSVYAAESSGSVPAPPPASLLPGVTDAPVVASVAVIGTPQSGQQVVSCTPARGAQSYEFQASGDSGASWFALGTSSTPQLTVSLAAGSWQVRARAIGTLAGPWAVWIGTTAVATYPPGAPTLTLQNAPFEGGAMNVNVSNARGDFRHVQVITGGVVRVEYDTTNYVIEWDLNLAAQYNATAPSVTFSVSENNEVGASPAPAEMTVTKPSPPAPAGAYSSDLSGNGSVSISAVSALDLDEYFIAEASNGAVLYQNAQPGAIAVTDGGPWSLYVTDKWGNTSPVTTVTATLLTP